MTQHALCVLSLSLDGEAKHVDRSVDARNGTYLSSVVHSGVCFVFVHV
jgi:hypothetical protein